MCGRPFDMQCNWFVFVFFSVKSCSRRMWTVEISVFQENEWNLYCTSERVYSMENRHFKLILPHWFRHKLYCVLFDASSIDWPTCACFWKCDCKHVLMQPMLLGVLACRTVVPCENACVVLFPIINTLLKLFFLTILVRVYVTTFFSQVLLLIRGVEPMYAKLFFPLALSATKFNKM